LVETAAGDARRTARRIEGAAAVTFMEAPMACERAEGCGGQKQLEESMSILGLRNSGARHRGATRARRARREDDTARASIATKYRAESPGGVSRRAGEDRGVPAWLFARV
jgi:hypothetical protein